MDKLLYPGGHDPLSAKEWENVTQATYNGGGHKPCLGNGRFSPYTTDFMAKMAKHSKNGYSDSDSNSNSNSNSNCSFSMGGEGNQGWKSLSRPPQPVRENKEGRKEENPVKVLLRKMKKLLNMDPTLYIQLDLEDCVRDYGPELCHFAIERAAEEGKARWSYIRGILRSLRREGIFSRECAKNIHEDYVKNRRYATQEKTTPGRRKKSEFQTHEKLTLTPLERDYVQRAFREMEELENQGKDG